MSKGAATVVICDDSGLLFSDDYRDGWKQGFEAIGCNVHIVDIRAMAKMVKLQGVRSVISMRGMGRLPAGIASQVTAKRPDLVFFHHGRTGSQDFFVEKLRKGGCRTAVYLCDEPYECGETAYYSRKYNFVFTMDHCTIKVHQHGRKPGSVFYLPPGVNTSHFRLYPYAKRSGPPVFFLGNGTLTPRPAYLNPILKLVDGADIRFMKTVTKQHPKWLPLKDHPKAYSNCMIGLNVHRAPWTDEKCWRTRSTGRTQFAPGIHPPKKPPAKWGTGFWNEGNLPASHWNPRFMEMAACGTLVVNDDHRAEMAREFPYVPQAENPDHFVELVMYYLSHLSEAEEIGRQCSYQISRRHTYAHRAAEILVRCGLKEKLSADALSFLGEPRDWLTPQDSELLKGNFQSGQTGRLGRWHPPSGWSSTGPSGSVRDTGSIDIPKPWLL